MRRTIIILLSSVALLFLAAAVLRSRTFQIDTLRAPISVKSWSADGLLLTDGRTLLLPGLRTLPSRSAALAEVTKRGVEIGDDGRVYGLVRVHHWCGNDPVREHIARVDISDMMIFLRAGETVDSVPEAESGERNLDWEFSKWGWRVGQFFEFQSWQRSKTSAHEPGA